MTCAFVRPCVHLKVRGQAWVLILIDYFIWDKVSFFFSLFWDWVSLCRLVGLEPATLTRPAWNLQRWACLCFPKAMHYHIYFFFFFLPFCVPGTVRSRTAGQPVSRASPDSAFHLVLKIPRLTMLCPVFHGFWGYELRSSCWSSKCFAHWAIISARHKRFYRSYKRLHSKVMCPMSWGPWSQIHSLCLLSVTPPQRPSPPPPTVSAQSPAPPLPQGPPRTSGRLWICPAGVWWKPDNFLATLGPPGSMQKKLAVPNWWLS